MARVVVAEGGSERTLRFDSNLLVIGSDRSCGLVLTAPDVAPLHCELRGGPDGWRVVDLESRAGTRVNGQFVNSRLLADGDVIEVGGARLAFHADVLVGPGAAAAGPALAPAAAPAAPARPAPVPRSAAAGRARRADADGRAGDEGDEPRRRRPASRSTAPATALLVVAALAGLALLAWLVLRAVSSDTHNHAVRIRMAAAADRLSWQEVLDVSREAVPDESHDWQEIRRMAEHAKASLQGVADAERGERSNGDWVALRVWRQDHYTSNDEYVKRIDEYLATYAGLETEGVRHARAERVKVTGTSSGVAADGPDAAWKTMQDDVRALEGEGRYGDAVARVEGWWTAHGAARPAMNVTVEQERNRLHEAAEKWFGRQVLLADHQWKNGEKKRARRTIEEAARKIGLPGYEDRAMEALRTIEGK